MPTLLQNVLSVSKAEVGVREGFKNGHWNNDQKYSKEVPGLAWSNFQPWCCTWVSWVAWKAGAAALYPSTASCDAAGAWFKKLGRWSEYPAIGAQVFFGLPRDLNHTGIVIAYDADTITTREGNTNLTGSREGDGVYQRTRQRRSADVIGYGYPAFSEGIQSADPAWVSGFKGKAPTAKPAPAPPTSGALRVDGVDLSHHNTVTASALTAAKNAGVRFGWHKVTESHGFIDGQYATRRRLCKTAGIPFGAYHFARPDNGLGDGTAEAKFFLANAKPAPGDLRPMLDLEADGGLGRAALTTWVGQFVAEVKKQTGVLPIIYTPFDLGDAFGCMLWVARYSNTNAAPKIPAPWKTARIRQFSNGIYGKPNWIAGLGAVDLNTLPGTAADAPIDWLKISTPVVTPKPSTPPKPAAVTIANLQLNTQHTDPANTQLRDLGRLADVVGLNEVEADWQHELLVTMTRFGVFPTTGTAAYVPILWVKSRFDLLDSGTIKVNDGVSGITPTRNVNWVHLRHKASGKTFTRINTQVVHHIESAGRPMTYKGAEVKSFAGQQDRARAHFAILRDLTAERSKLGPVIVGGDLNVDLFAEMKLPREKRTPWFPLTMLGPVAKPIVPKSGTLGSRAIDWLLVDGCTVTSDEVLPLGASDHHGRLSTIALP